MAQSMHASEPKRYGKIILLTSLYTSQFLPSAFFFQGLPVFMRQQDTSLEVIGLLGFLTLPWMLKFLWAPLIDLYGWSKWGHYKSWIVGIQSLLAIVLVACSNIDASENAAVLFGSVFLIVTLAATQDIATDALAFNLLTPSERGWGNGIQSAGRSIGGIIGGGVMLLVLNQVGWHMSLWILAATVLLALLPLLKYRETRHHTQPDSFAKETPGATNQTSQTPAYFKTLLSFFRRPGVWHWLFFIWLYVTGTSIASSMFRPLLVDIDLSMAEIGWIKGIVGSVAAIIGSLLAGGLIQPLGRRRALVMFGLLQAIAVLALILPAIGITHKAVLYTVSSGELFARALATTALFTVMMDKSREASAGSDYTLQSSAYMIGHHVGIPAFSGFIASSVGYTGVFSISFLFCLLGAWLATRVKCD